MSSDQVQLIKKALTVLRSAPEKERIIFEPYWLWSRHERDPLVKELEEALSEAKSG